MKIHTHETTLFFGDLADPKKAIVKYKKDGSMITLLNISIGETDTTNYLDVIMLKSRERIKREIEAEVFDLDCISDAVYDWDPPGSAS
jgi:hypothetical protein